MCILIKQTKLFFRKVVKHELIVGNHFKQLLKQKIRLKVKDQLYLNHQNTNPKVDNRTIVMTLCFFLYMYIFIEKTMFVYALSCLFFFCLFYMIKQRKNLFFFLFDLIKKEKTLSTQRVNYLHTNSSHFLFRYYSSPVIIARI